MSASRIIVTIDEVRLHGFDPLDRSAIGDALQRELTRLLAVEPVVSAARRTARVDAGALPLARGDGAPTIGARIAARVHREISRPC